jgi:polyferredoxin
LLCWGGIKIGIVGDRVRRVAMLEFLKRKITKDQSRDTGMAVVLLLLILSIRTRREGVLWAAIALQVVNMIVPRIYAPLAVVWLGFSHLLGTVMSKILLSILFFGVVTPIGVLRRLFGKDSLKLRAFKASEESVMLLRNHIFVGRDIEKPY